ncbi:MAG: phosphopentomutase [Candidatus Krumholzibacteriota bacterium]|nr:phosphopentomutase [Candidatus Krumholzibacteriota bacterium]
MDRKAVIIVLDGVGAGALPDAADYGDRGAHTLAHVAEAAGGLRLPVLGEMGLGLVAPFGGSEPPEFPAASFGRMAERSPGKDSATGHWELAGCPLDEPFPLFPNGFPESVLRRFADQTGLEVIGNRAASGTEIIEELGRWHLETGRPILYTSADSVFQLAAHERVMTPERLYELCLEARRILVAPWNVARVIARPFDGEPGAFRRTAGRRDFSLPPPRSTILDELSSRGFKTVTIGKIHDLFAGRGIDRVIPAPDNRETMAATDRLIDGDWSFLFVNLIDFDTVWGHRRDPAGFAAALEEADAWLGNLRRRLPPGTLFAVTADHGCDPVAPGSDHTREYVPVLAARAGERTGRCLGDRATFADLAATVADHFGFRAAAGNSFLDEIGWRNR